MLRNPRCSMLSVWLVQRHHIQTSINRQLIYPLILGVFVPCFNNLFFNPMIQSVGQLSQCFLAAWHQQFLQKRWTTAPFGWTTRISSWPFRPLRNHVMGFSRTLFGKTDWHEVISFGIEQIWTKSCFAWKKNKKTINWFLLLRFMMTIRQSHAEVVDVCWAAQWGCWIIQRDFLEQHGIEMHKLW